MAGNIPTKPTIEKTVLDFNSQLAVFLHGHCYISDGGFLALSDIAPEMFIDQASTKIFLDANSSLLSDLSEKPGKFDSKVVKLKTTNYIIEGKRTNSASLNLVGLNADRKKYLEEELNSTDKTFILQSADQKHLMIFNKLRWSYEGSTELNSLFNSTIATEFSGPTSLSVIIIDNIPAS